MAIPKILDHERKLKNIQDGTGELSIKEGSTTKASGEASHAEGDNTLAAGNYSHAEGSYTITNNTYSHAEGYQSEATGIASHAEGDSVASGDYSHAEGSVTLAEGKASHAEGYNTCASGNYSHAEGRGNDASGTNSHAEGRNTLAKGNSSHAEGSYTEATDGYSHAEGFQSVASGDTSHAEGDSTEAHGAMSHSEGWGSIANGKYSHAEGLFTTANGECQHTQGSYNIEDNDDEYLHIVGNGTEDDRSNAYTLDWSGNAWFAGDVYVGSTSGTNKDDGSKKLATEEYVDNNGGIFWATSETTFDELWSAWNMGKLLCISPVGNGLGLSDTYVCDGIINYDSGNNDRIFSFSPASPTSSMSLVGGGYAIWCSQTSGWESGASVYVPVGATVHSTLKRSSTTKATPLSAAEAYYRPIYTSTQEPTASDGKVGDIWIVYTE